EETSLTGGVKNDYVYFDGKRIARHTSSSTNYFYLEDHLGSSRVMTDASGNVCSDADFLPFGQEVDYTSTCAQNYKFEGKERDIETGNDNFGARYYRSALGRWQSPDWSAIPEAVPYANLINPQTLNLYQFVEDDPESYADLDGHQEKENGQGNNQSATTTTTTCTDSGGRVNDDGETSCTTTKVDDNHPITPTDVIKGISDAIVQALTDTFNLGNQIAATVTGNTPPPPDPDVQPSTSGENKVMQVVSLGLVLIPESKAADAEKVGVALREEKIVKNAEQVAKYDDAALARSGRKAVKQIEKHLNLLKSSSESAARSIKIDIRHNAERLEAIIREAIRRNP
ncbi:MAG TPA: RHS repeat-associated core domain-containing protein, partial [Terriglobales bacterium]|nr:RHS repeat-associated core domain-containing protein [Terriglobales bacterium]